VGYPISWAPCCKTWLKKKKVDLLILRKMLDFAEKKSFVGMEFVPKHVWAPFCEGKLRKALGRLSEDLSPS
jgi:hypothetical protein